VTELVEAALLKRRRLRPDAPDGEDGLGRGADGPATDDMRDAPVLFVLRLAASLKDATREVLGRPVRSVCRACAAMRGRRLLVVAVASRSPTGISISDHVSNGYSAQLTISDLLHRPVLQTVKSACFPNLHPSPSNMA